MQIIDLSAADDDRLPDDVLVCRGGSCSAKAFQQGSGVTIDAAENLQNVSVNASPARTLAELTTSLPHRDIGTTTVGAVRRAGGEVVSDARGPNNPWHCLPHGITPAQAESLFAPTVPNPNRP